MRGPEEGEWSVGVSNAAVKNCAARQYLVEEFGAGPCRSVEVAWSGPGREGWVVVMPGPAQLPVDRRYSHGIEPTQELPNTSAWSLEP